MPVKKNNYLIQYYIIRNEHTWPSEILVGNLFTCHIIYLCALCMDTENGRQAIKCSMAGLRCSSKDRENCLCSGVKKSEIAYKKYTCKL